ncbi:MAG: phenylacetate--CoA ligase family protein [Thermoanaerobaculia bacterium]
MSGAWLKIYQSLPPPLRTAAATARGIQLRSRRYGPETERLCAEALARDRWSAGRWEAWRSERLAFVLHRAATKVPYYRQLWEKRRRAGDRASWEMLENWPLLEKEPLRAHPEAFVAEDRDIRRMHSEHTSRTTGTPIRLWRTRETERAWYALFEARVRRWNGVSRADRWAIFGGQLVTPVERRSPPFWVWNAGLRQLYLSVYHLSEATAPAYAEALLRYRVRYAVGYPSALDSLAQFAAERGIACPSLHVVVSNAEPLFPYQRERIAAAFRSPVRDTYGLVEIVCAASECDSGRLHLWPEAGAAEVLRDFSEDPAAPGDQGRLVCTGLLNADMPLIRYVTGDRGALRRPAEACGCGRSLPELGTVEGRSDDVLLTADGRRIGRLDPVFKSGVKIREAQIVQDAVDAVRVLVVPAPGFGPQDARKIEDALSQRLGSGVRVRIEPIEAVPRTSAGKFRAVVSRLSPKEPPK